MVTVALFARGSQSRERKGSCEVSGNRACPGQSRNDNAYMVRTTIGADDLRNIRRFHGRKRTPGSSEWSHSESTDGASLGTILEAPRNRAH